jgi:hypothetical protein
MGAAPARPPENTGSAHTGSHSFTRPPAFQPPEPRSPGQGGHAGQPSEQDVRDDHLTATVHRARPVGETAEEEHPEDTGKRNLWLAIAGGTILVVAIVLGIVLFTTRGEPQVLKTEEVSQPPADPLDDGTVPEVALLKGVVGAGGKVTFTWNNPSPKQGDVYKWRLKDAEFNVTSTPRVEVVGKPGEYTCIQVFIVRTDGTTSPGDVASMECAAT